MATTTGGARAAPPLVDLIIPVHDPRREIGRAVGSVLDGAPSGVRVTVICHGIGVDSVAEQLAGWPLESLRIVEFADGIHAPTGPFNYGLQLATGDYVSVMGSDDFLEPGTMAAWVQHVRTRSPDVLLAALRFQNGAVLRNPLTRPWRRRNLDPVKDRLFYRSAPLGLVRRSVLESLEPRFTVGVPAGGDLAVSSRLWAGDLTIDLASSDACYVIGSDADARVTTAPRSATEALAAVRDLVARDWLDRASPAMRCALAVKLIRVHLIGAVLARPAGAQWSDASVDSLRECLHEVLALADRALDPFPRVDRDLIDRMTDAATTPESLAAAARQHSRSTWAARVLPRSGAHLFDREGVLVRYLLYAIDPVPGAAVAWASIGRLARRKARASSFHRA